MIDRNSFVSLTSISGGVSQTSLQLLSQPLVGPDGVLQTLTQRTDLTQMLLDQVHTWQHKQTWHNQGFWNSSVGLRNSEYTVLLCVWIGASLHRWGKGNTRMAVSRLVTRCSSEASDWLNHVVHIPWCTAPYQTALWFLGLVKGMMR